MIRWDVSPEIFRFKLDVFGGTNIALRWYSVAFMLSFIVGFLIMKKRFQEKGHSLDALDACFVSVMLGTIIGARLGHVLFYEPMVYLKQPWRIPMVWEGGLASHGGTIGVFLALVWFTRKYKVPLIWLLDEIVLPIAFAAGMIRLGNLMNSEIIGRPAEVPWAFVFERVDDLPRHPAQLYESLVYFATLGTLWFLRGRLPESRRPGTGFLFGLFFVLVFGARFLIEFLKERQVAFEAGLPLDMGQLLSIPCVLIGLFMMFLYRPKGRDSHPTPA